MRELLVPSALNGELGVRNVTALTSVCKVLLEYDRLEALEERVAQLEEEAKQS